MKTVKIFIVPALLLFSACGPQSSAPGSATHAESDCSKVHQALSNKADELENAKKEIDRLKTDNNTLQVASQNLRDPTWKELSAFLSTTKQEKKYESDNFNCMHFSIWLKDRARDRGFRAAFVNFYYEGKSVGHAINAFDTLDYGRIYIEPQGNQIAYLKNGEKYGTIGMNHVKRKYYACPNSTDQFTSSLYVETYPGNIFEYDYFLNYRGRMDCYFKGIESYNAAVEKYNSNHHSRLSHQQINTWKNNLALLENDLGRTFSEEPSIVSKSKSLWN